jgi:exopolyphosphatase / guanosine-5'-triphosphate,3'-diphosphate pyrophosphatase
VGTSALREAIDSGYFIDSVRQETGLNIKILSGEEEATLTLKGINLPDYDGEILALDIGGGSTELILRAEAPIKFSLPLGALKLSEQFIVSDPPSPSEISSMKAQITVCLSPALSLICEEPSFDPACLVVMTGGTPTTLAAIKMSLADYDGEKIHGFRLNYADICSLFEKLANISLTERMNIAGIEKERADIILSGTMIVITLMELLSIKEITVSDCGLMEGILLSDQ